MPFKDAVDRAVEECIDNDVLADFLIKHRAEVLDVCITEYNEKSFVNGIREEGIQQGIEETLASLVEDKILTIEEAAKRAGKNVDEFKEMMERIRQQEKGE